MNAEQFLAFNTVTRDKQNVLITGGAGVGKSFVIGKIKEYFDKNNINYGVTATTGSAAFLINGTTIHNFFGLKIRLKSVDATIRRLKKNNKKQWTTLNKLDALVIDEVSMLNDILMEFIHLLLQTIKDNTKPFGGVQIILCGDMCQLPPCDGELFTEAPVWVDNNEDWKTVELIETIRQKDDTKFANILKRIRNREYTAQDIVKLKEMKKIKSPTVLFSTNKKVDEFNNKKLQSIIGKGAKSKTFKATHSIEEVTLCEGCKVMLTTNIDIEKGLCNGAIGKILEIQSSTQVLVKFNNGMVHPITYVPVFNDEDEVIDNNLPLRAAYAITINKCQGMTLDAIVLCMDDFDVFRGETKGRFYTAISRVRKLEHICVVGDVKKKHVV